jgi:hypothetical protein
MAVSLDNLFEKYEIDEQIKSIRKVPNITKYIVILAFMSVFLAGFEFLMIKLFSFSNFQTYLYPVYGFIIGFSILIISNFNYKVIILAISLFSFIKYIFYYLDEIAKVYSQSLIFDLYVLSLTFFVIFLISILEYFVFILYGFLSLITNIFSFIFIFIKQAKELKVLIIVPILAGINYFLYYVMSQIILASTNDKILIFSLLTLSIMVLILISMYIMFRFILGSYIYLGGNTKLKLETFIFDMYSNMRVSYPIYKIFKNTNNFLNKIHENLEFIGLFKFENSNKFMKAFYLIIICLWAYSFYSLYNYYNTYQYDLSFFEKNNGYCSNLDKDSLIMKNNNSSDSVFIISDNNIESSYVYRDSYKNKKNTKNDILFNEYSATEKYYIYEKSCLKKI